MTFAVIIAKVMGLIMRYNDYPSIILSLANSLPLASSFFMAVGNLCIFHMLIALFDVILI